MEIVGLINIKGDLNQAGYFVKCILTPHAAVFFPGIVQHRDVKQAGATYEDDYQGNALAATIAPGRVDIRYHREYSDDVVRAIWSDVLRNSEMLWALGHTVTYQGRPLMC